LKEYRWKIEILWEKPEELKKDIIDSMETTTYNKKPLTCPKGWPKGLILTPSQEQGATIKEKLKSIPQIYTKKFLLIQWWCDSFCTFCLTVIKRWKHYYRDKDDIVEEILNFEKVWWKEVVLTWVNLSAWWLESTNPPPSPLPIKEGEHKVPSRFAELLRHILDNTTIPRIRISSMWPEFIDDACLEIFKETRIYPHFHYSVQSWSSHVLKSMHRHYDWKYMRDLLEKTKNIARKDAVEVSIWADLIVWFPWETDDDFDDTYNLVKDWLITKIHGFPFSPHTTWESVPAWSFPDQISDNIKKDRMWKLEEIGEQIRDNFIEINVWKEFEVLLEVVKIDEKTWKTIWKWWTQNYIDVDNTNFEVISWTIKRNEIIKGKLIK
jgi:tRNA A37 methylthiotransferase MiaB